MLRALLLVSTGLLESLTWTWNDDVPVVVGVPEMEPELERVRPAGSEPWVTFQRYGGTPPLAARLAEYAEPTLPAGSCDVVIFSGATTVTVPCMTENVWIWQ
jgi:hypothetical protein